MKRNRYYYYIGILVLFIIIQLIPVERENPASNSQLEITAPPQVKTILKKSCYDCHSNQTNWPFYSYIAPISWFITSDVKEGRRHVNFTEWNNLSPEKKKRVKEELLEEISEDGMPLPSYRMMHPDAKLSDEQKAILKDWVEK